MFLMIRHGWDMTIFCRLEFGVLRLHHRSLPIRFNSCHYDHKKPKSSIHFSRLNFKQIHKVILIKSVQYMHFSLVNMVCFHLQNLINAYWYMKLIGYDFEIYFLLLVIPERIAMKLKYFSHFHLGKIYPGLFYIKFYKYCTLKTCAAKPQNIFFLK